MLYNELEQGHILSDVRLRLATRAYTDIPLRSIGPVHKIRQSPVEYCRDNVRRVHQVLDAFIVEHGRTPTPQELRSVPIFLWNASPGAWSIPQSKSLSTTHCPESSGRSVSCSRTHA